MVTMTAKFKKLLRYGFLLICLGYIAGVVVYTYNSMQELSGRIESELGNKAMLLAMSVAQNQDISSQEFDRLAALDFDQLLKDPANVGFEAETRALMQRSDIKYIYLEAPIAGSQIKYQVESGEEGTYEMPAGTPLDVIYLLDSVVDDETRWEDTDGQWYSDKDRYTVRNDQFARALEDGQPCYFINSDQWGTYITGYAPYINGEGRCLGLIGVDLFMDNYTMSLQQSRSTIAIMLLSSIFMGLFAAFLAMKLRSSEMMAEQKTVLSRTDPLTELYNRRHFMERMASDWQECTMGCRPMSFIMIDVDFLKEYNDNYGHLSGDRVLRHVAGVIAGAIDPNSGVVGRYGGDEFVISLPGASRDQAMELARLIGGNVCQWPRDPEEEDELPHPTVSIGVATMIPNDTLRMEDLIDQADRIMYQAKINGRNRVCGEIVS